MVCFRTARTAKLPLAAGVLLAMMCMGEARAQPPCWCAQDCPHEECLAQPCNMEACACAAGCQCGAPQGCPAVNLLCSGSVPFCPCEAGGCPKQDPNSDCGKNICSNGPPPCGGFSELISCVCNGEDCLGTCDAWWCVKGTPPDPYVPCDGPLVCGDTGCEEDPCGCGDLCPWGTVGGYFDCYISAGCCLGQCQCTGCPMSATCGGERNCYEDGCDSDPWVCQCPPKCAANGNWECGGEPGACEQGGSGEGMALMLRCADLCDGQCDGSCCPQPSECTAADCW